MTASRDDIEADEESPVRRAYRGLVGGVRWLREFNRGYSGTGHLPNRED